MSLRLRAMLAFGCPNTSVTKAGDEEFFLPSQCVADVMTGVMNHRIKKVQDSTSDNVFLTDEDVADGTAACDNNSPVDHSAFSTMSIEDLDLSVRANISLKRAGIHTVADLLDKTDEELMSVRNLGRKCFDEVKEKLAALTEQYKLPEKTASSYTEMLDGLVGLKNVKEQVKKITAYAKLKRDMESADRDASPIVLNMEFTGNPGTAKTTVARIVAGILHEIGLLQYNELVEVGRADLIARYVGQTADKVKTVFRQARGKLLFIDEAYSLLESRKGDFGDEAINTIVQEMENNRKDTVVIFAGYPDEMKEFFSRNPGLRSRVPFTVSFSDYSVEELVSITELEAQKRGFSVSPSAHDKITAICETAAHDAAAGNGRFCRNLSESAILNYAYRVYGADDNTANTSFVLQADDYVVPEDPTASCESCPIGFVA